MHRGTWSTKEDVLKDLEVVSGRRVADVDDGFFIVGEQPPPRRVLDDEDDEIELRFGRRSTEKKLNADGENGPDLKGITQMLRMVQDYDDSSHEETTIKAAIASPKSKNDVIVISKLNPNVKEFIPKSTQIGSCQNVLKTNDKAIADSVTGAKLNSIDNEMTTRSKETIANSSIMNGIGSNSSLLESKNITSKIIHNSTSDSAAVSSAEQVKKPSDYEAMAALLKSKISAKKDTFEEKHKTNLAIVNLLKLYARPDKKTTESFKTLKLYTPQFFEKCKASEFKSNDDNLKKDETSVVQTTALLPSVEVKNYVCSEKPREEQHKKIDTAIKESNFDNNNFERKNNDCSVFNNEEHHTDDYGHETKLTPEMADTAISIGVHTTPSIVVKEADSEIEESITKVNNWFENDSNAYKEKPKNPAVYLGTVAYKRKDPVTCKSPSDVADKKIPKPSDIAYQPSSYADELLEKYKKKSQKKAPVLNIWDKLEEDLKRKDQEIYNAKKKTNA